MSPGSSWQGHMLHLTCCSQEREGVFSGGAEVALSRGLELINRQLLLTPLINREALHNSLPPSVLCFSSQIIKKQPQEEQSHTYFLTRRV